MGDSIPKQIVTSRRKLEKKFAEEYAVTEAELADFFMVPIKVIKKDLSAEAIKLNSDLEPFPLEKQKRLYSMKVTNSQRKGMSHEEALVKHGFWIDRNYIDIESVTLFSNFEEGRRNLLKKAYAMLKVGFTISDVSQICKLKKREVEILRCESEKIKNKDVFFSWAKEQYNKTAEKSDVKDHVSAVGASEAKLLRGENYYYDKKKKANNLPASVYVAKVSKEVRNTRKEEAYEKWLNGETQQEIANSYEVDRVTIGNWIREIKAKKGELFSDEYRRNTSEKGRLKSKDDKADRRNACIKKIRPLIDKGATITAMSKATGHCDETIKRYMKEAGLWDKYLEIRPELKKKK